MQLLDACLYLKDLMDGEENALGFIAVKFVIFVVSGIVFFVMGKKGIINIKNE